MNLNPESLTSPHFQKDQSVKSESSSSHEADAASSAATPDFVSMLNPPTLPAKLSPKREPTEAQMIIDLMRRRMEKKAMDSTKKKSVKKLKRDSRLPEKSERPNRRKQPAYTIRQSTTTFGQLPAAEQVRNGRNGTAQPGYWLQRSEVEIRPIEDIPSSKRFPLKKFLQQLFGPKLPVSPLPNVPNFPISLKKSSTGDPVKNLVEMLTGMNHKFAGTAAKDDGKGREIGGNRLELDGNDLEMDGTSMKVRGTSHPRRWKREIGENQTSDMTPEEVRRLARVAAPFSHPVTGTVSKRKYTPIFRECNETAASEISDLNAAPPSPNQSTGKLTHIRDIDYPRSSLAPPLATLSNSEGVADSRKTPKEAPVHPVAGVVANTTYINLQDHQNEAKGGAPGRDANGYPLDIAPYNPDMIPYVEVPDYSDQREESLDEDDRRVAKERYVENPDEDADVIDPTVPLRDDQRSEKIIVTEHYPQAPKNAEEKPKSDDLEETPESDDLEDEPKSDDVEDRSRSDDVEDRPELGGLEERVEDEDLVRLSKDDEAEDEVTETRGDEREQVNDKEPEEAVREQLGVEESLPKVEEIEKFKPVHFDISEYKKPFNLEQLLKEFGMESAGFEEDDEDKEAKGTNVKSVRQESTKVDDREGEVKTKEERDNYFGQEFPSFWSHETPKKNEEQNEGEGVAEDKSGKLFESDPVFERLFKSSLPSKVFSFSDSKNRKDDSDDKIGARFSFGDQNTYERLFSPEEREDPFKDVDHFQKKSEPESNEEEKAKEKEDSTENEKQDVEEAEGEDEEDARYSEPAGEDQDESQQHSKKSKPDEEPVDGDLVPHVSGETYKTLETIMAKKDDISRLEPEVAERAKKGQMPAHYKNQWTLEYGTPKKDEER